MPKAAIFILCLIIIPPFSGCGRKTMVVPPDTTRPAAINDLVLDQDETGITLRWTPPGKSSTGDALTEPVTTFEIERAISPINDFCPDCPVNFRRLATVKINPGESPRWRDTKLEPGMVYTYRIAGRNGLFGRSLPSRPMEGVWGGLPPTPPPPKAAGGDQMITLTWPGNHDYGYQLEKSTAAGTAVIDSGDAGNDDIVFRDRRVKNTTKYVYRLRLVREMGKGLRLRGPASLPAIATPRDLTPPPPVIGVQALRSKNGVTVLWEPVMTADLAGYRIYRKDRGDEKLIGTTTAAATNFIDTDPPINTAEWRYRVIAFDHAKPANQSAPSAAAIIRRIR